MSTPSPAPVTNASSEAQVFDLVESHSRVILGFYAPWAAPCVQMNSVFDALAASAASSAPRPADEMGMDGDTGGHAVRPDILFVRVPADALPTVAAHFNVASVPAFVALHTSTVHSHGRVVARTQGANPRALATVVEWLTSATSAQLDTAAWTEATKAEEVMLFLKGDPDSPKCASSRQAVDILRRNGIVFGYIDVLTDPELREGLKLLHNWSTYPQLYARGRLVGGLDILRERAETNQLIAELARDTASDANPDQPSPGPTESAAPGKAKMIAPTSANDTISALTPPPTHQTLEARLRALVTRSPVMLFMKGEPDAPRCGFSKKIVALLRDQGLVFDTFDILDDPVVRQGLKDLFQWPTFPQLYSNGTLIGGLDIVRELSDAGALRDELAMGIPQ
jgi:Grx4 family monothiol glutaredoxin